MKSLYASLLKDRQPSISAYEMVVMPLDPTRTQAKPSSGMPMQEVTFLGNFWDVVVAEKTTTSTEHAFTHD
jgi:hypothetical protein